MIIKLMDWSLLTEQEKYDWVDNSSPENIVHYINSMNQNKLGLADRLDRAKAEINLLREQLQKIPYIMAGGQHEKKDS